MPAFAIYLVCSPANQEKPCTAGSRQKEITAFRTCFRNCNAFLNNRKKAMRIDGKLHVMANGAN
jgi:hypothetical protein